MTSPVGWMVTVTVAPGSVLPSMVGVLSLVRPSPFTPESDAGSSQALGASGAMVSITTGSTVVPVLPAGSSSVTTMSTGPSGIGSFGVTDQLPLGSTVVVAFSPVGNTTVMVSPGSPVPVMVGVLLGE